MKSFDRIIPEQKVVGDKSTENAAKEQIGTNFSRRESKGRQEIIPKELKGGDYDRFVLDGQKEKKSAERSLGVILEKVGILSAQEAMGYQKGLDGDLNWSPSLQKVAEKQKDKNLLAVIPTITMFQDGMEEGILSGDDFEHALQLMGEKKKTTQEISRIRNLLGLKHQEKDPAASRVGEQIRRLEEKCQRALFQRDLETVKGLHEYVKEGVLRSTFPEGVEKILYSARFGSEVYTRTQGDSSDLGRQELQKHLSEKTLRNLSDLKTLYDTQAISQSDFNTLIESTLAGSDPRSVIDNLGSGNLEEGWALQKRFSAFDALKAAVRTKRISFKDFRGYVAGIKELYKKSPIKENITEDKPRSTLSPEGMADEKKEEVASVEKKDLSNPPFEVAMDREREIILSERDIEGEGKSLGGAIGSAMFVRLENDGAAVFKSYEKHDDTTRNRMIGTERAMYLIDRALGFNFVPPTVIREANGKVGSMQEFVPDLKHGAEIQEGDISLAEQLKLKFFDFVIQNDDRWNNPWNYLVNKKGNIIAIDHGETYSYWSAGIPEEFSQNLVSPQIIENLKKFSSSKENVQKLYDSVQALLGEKTSLRYIARIHAIAQSISEDGRLSQKKFQTLMDNFEELEDKRQLSLDSFSY